MKRLFKREAKQLDLTEQNGQDEQSQVKQTQPTNELCPPKLCMTVGTGECMTTPGDSGVATAATAAPALRSINFTTDGGTTDDERIWKELV